MWQPKEQKKQQFVYFCFEFLSMFVKFRCYFWHFVDGNDIINVIELCDCKAQVIKSFFGLIRKYMGFYWFWCVKVNVALLTMQLLVNIRPINKSVHVINLTLSMLVKNQAHRWNWCWVNRNSYFLSKKSNSSIPSIEKTYIIITKSWSNL